METWINPEGIKRPYRKHTCWACNYSWLAPVRFAKVGQVANVSHECTEFCMMCGKASSMSTAWQDMNGEDYFKEVE